jgi:hypothetical protein
MSYRSGSVKGVVMSRRNIFLLAIAAACFLWNILGPALTVYAQDDWKTEFETVCAKTQDPGALSDDELKNLVERCDRLRPLIEKLDETQKKVYLKRLQMCRNLFAFILETREKK